VYVRDSDPVVRWIQEEDGGHCEYFSAALVLLCRAAGVPARIVTGFHGGSWNGFENHFMVKNADAHAWVEVFDGEKYWVRVDPTPGGNLAVLGLDDATENASPFVDSSVTAYFDSLKILWYRRVVNFDNVDQVAIVDGVSSSFKDLVESIKGSINASIDEFKTLIYDPFNKERLTLFGIAFVTFFGGYLVLRILLSRMRARAYFKFFGTRKRKRVKQLKERVLAGQLLDRYRRKLSENNPNESIVLTMNQLMLIRFGSVESWPTVSLELRRAKKLIKSL
jgi:hypothetical protein